MYSLKYIFSKIIKKMHLSSIHNCNIHTTSKIESGSTIINTSFGKHSFCGYECTMLNCDIGSFCSIASRVVIGGARHPTEFVSTSPVFLSHKDSVKAKFAHHSYLPVIRTTVGSDVWIGEGVFIKAGVAIGDGAVVGMGSIVTKNVEPYSIVAGNPARLIRMRFEQEIIAALLKMKWWDLPDTDLHRLGPYFHDPKSMLEKEGLL